MAYWAERNEGRQEKTILVGHDDLKIENSYLSQFLEVVGWLVHGGFRMAVLALVDGIVSVGSLGAVCSCRWRLTLVGQWWILDDSVICVGGWCSCWLMTLVGQCWSMCMRFICRRRVGTSPGQCVCVGGSHCVGKIKIL